LEGWGWQRVHDPAVLPEVLERWQASIATGQSFEMTFPLRGADGRFRPFLTCVTPLHDADGAVVRWVGINTDVGAERAARDAAERAAERAARLQALTAALAGARTEADVARVVVAEAVTVTGAATGAVTRRVAHSAAVPATEAEIVQEAGLPPDVATTWRRFPLDAPGPAAECIRTGTPIWLESRAALDARFPALHREWDRIAAAALATVPLVVGGEVVGAMTYTFREPRPIPAEDRAFFLALAGQASQALERARLFAAERAAREAAEAAGARVAFLAEASARLAGVARR
jgi:hypothetical protein